MPIFLSPNPDNWSEYEIVSFNNMFSFFISFSDNTSILSSLSDTISGLEEIYFRILYLIRNSNAISILHRYLIYINCNFIFVLKRTLSLHRLYKKKYYKEIKYHVHFNVFSIYHSFII